MEKILCIIRVSTLSQEMESQHNDMLSFCRSIGYDDNEIYWLESAGASARSLNKKYLDMLEEIKNLTKEIKVVAVYHLNRLGRVESKLMEMKEYFISNHIQVYVKEPSITLLDEHGKANPSAEIAWSIFSTMVKFDTEEMFSKMKRGKEYKRSLGFIVDGGIPYGLLNIGQKLAPDPEKAPHIIKLFNMYLNGYSVLQLRDYLSSLGWPVTTVHINRMLSNERYRLIISDEVFEAVQSLKKRKQTQSSKERTYNFGQQLIRCSKCGAYYIKYKYVYSCVHHKHIYRNTKDYCESIGVSSNRLDCMLVETAWRWFDVYTHRNGSQRAEELLTLISEHPTKYKAIQRKIDTISERLDRCAELYTDGIWNKQKYTEKVKSIKDEKSEYDRQLTELNNQLKRYEEELSDIDNMIITSKNNSDIVDKMTKRELYDLVHKFIEYVTIVEYGIYKEVQIYSRLVHDEKERVRKFRFKGIGTAYKLYLVNPNNDNDMTDITDIENYKRIY